MSRQSVFIEMPSTGCALELTYHGQNFMEESAAARRFILGLVARMERVRDYGFPDKNDGKGKAKKGAWKR